MITTKIQSYYRSLIFIKPLRQKSFTLMPSPIPPCSSPMNRITSNVFFISCQKKLKRNSSTCKPMETIVFEEGWEIKYAEMIEKGRLLRLRCRCLPGLSEGGSWSIIPRRGGLRTRKKWGRRVPDAIDNIGDCYR